MKTKIVANMANRRNICKNVQKQLQTTNKSHVVTNKVVTFWPISTSVYA